MRGHHPRDSVKRQEEALSLPGSVFRGPRRKGREGCATYRDFLSREIGAKSDGHLDPLRKVDCFFVRHFG